MWTRTNELSLRRRRRRLLRRLDRIDSAKALYAFQKRLAGEIRRIEPHAFADRTSPARRHLRLLRLFGDALAWKELHPYSIRQLAKNPGKPPALHDQKGFPATLAIARRCAKAGLPALVADLSNCLRISDVIVCADPEHPFLIESGGHPHYALKGRKGRQLQRATAVGELLRNGYGRLPGERFTTVTQTIRAPVVRSFDHLQRAVADCLESGYGWSVAAEGDVIVVTGAGDFEIAPELFPLLDRMGAMGVGIHLRLLERPQARHAPPLAWPLPQAHRRALLEGDVVVVHFVDLDRLVGMTGPHGAITQVRTEGDAIAGIVAEGDGGELHLSPLFLNDVLYGFQTLDSLRQTIDEVLATPLGELFDAVPEAEQDSGREERPFPDASAAEGWTSVPVDQFLKGRVGLDR